ncbi:Uncharacterized protein GBIM_03897, partial [Gryllus bimaculatus]
MLARVGAAARAALPRVGCATCRCARRYAAPARASTRCCCWATTAGAWPRCASAAIRSLFRKRHPDRVDKYYWLELDEQPEWVTVSVEASVHADAVRQVAYCADNDTVVSCSADPNATIVVRHLAARRAPYVFRLAR